MYKTAKIYGQKSYDVKNERFIRAVKCCQKMQYAFPICDDPSLIGYHITKMSFNKLGESNCLKIIINHYNISSSTVTKSTIVSFNIISSCWMK